MLICMQKTNYITHFFFKILQSNSKLAILGNLGMPGHPHLKWQYQSKETFDTYLQAKNQLHPSCFPWVIAKILQTCYFGYFGHVWLRKPKLILLPCRKLLCLSAMQPKSQLHPPHFSEDIAKICKILILGTLGIPGYTTPKL